MLTCLTGADAAFLRNKQDQITVTPSNICAQNVNRQQQIDKLSTKGIFSKKVSHGGNTLQAKGNERCKDAKETRN